MRQVQSRRNTDVFPATIEATLKNAKPAAPPVRRDVQILTPEQAESRGWDKMVSNHALGSVFQHTAYVKAISATFKHVRPYYVSIVGSGGSCVGGLVLFLVKSWLTGRRLVATPFTFYADPMVNSAAECEAIVKEIVELSRRKHSSYVEIKTRKSAGLLTDSRVLVPRFYHKTYFLDLTKGLDAIWDGFHRTSIKQGIRKAERKCIRVRYAESEYEVMSFYDVLVRDRRRLGLPPQKPEFFQNIWRYLVPHALARFWLAYKEGKLVGGLCNFAFKETVFFGYIGIEEALRSFGVGQYLWWSAIRAACEEGLAVVDLGKASPRAEGQIKYKKRWGAVELATPSFYYPRPVGVSACDCEQKLPYRAVRLFWKKVPPRLSRTASRFFYRHGG